MATIRNQILDAIVSRLNGAGKPAALTVARFPVSNIEEASLPHVAVVPGRESVDRPSDKMRAYPVRERRLTVRVECRAKASGISQGPDEALDPLVAWTTKALLADATLGSLALECEESEISWQGDESDHRFGLAIVSFVVRYKTNSQDQEMKA